MLCLQAKENGFLYGDFLDFGGGTLARCGTCFVLNAEMSQSHLQAELNGCKTAQLPNPLNYRRVGKRLAELGPHGALGEATDKGRVHGGSSCGEGSSTRRGKAGNCQ